MLPELERHFDCHCIVHLDVGHALLVAVVILVHGECVGMHSHGGWRSEACRRKWNGGM